MILRQTFVPTYKVRGAVEEDNDYIVPLIEKYSKRLTEIYGKFYVAELLNQFQDNKRKIIVAEYKSTVVGVLFLNDYVNYQLLLTEFEIDPYNGLKKPSVDDLENFMIDDIVLYTPSVEQLLQNMDYDE